MSGMGGFTISGSSFSGSALPQLQQKQQATRAYNGSRGSQLSGGGRRGGGGGGGSGGGRGSGGSSAQRFRTNATKPRKSGGGYGQQRRDPDAPIAMERATRWSFEVEEAYRIQGSGWKSIREYRKANGDPARWENGFIKMTVHPKTGYFMYWSKDRQCADSFLNKVRLYRYANQPAALDHSNQERNQPARPKLPPQ